MPSGKSWNLTADRLKYVDKHLREQSSMGCIAAHFGIQQAVLNNKLRESGYDWKVAKAAGLTTLRRDIFRMITQLDPKDMVTEGMKYLGRYEVVEEDAAADTAVDIEAAAAQVLDDLNY